MRAEHVRGEDAQSIALPPLRKRDAAADPSARSARAPAARRRLVEEQIAGGTEGLVVGGTTGEGQLMSWDEHIMLIAHTVHRFGDKIAVIGNTGSNATREAVHATCQGFAVGMHAALHINPYYGKTSEDGLYRHFEEALSYGPSIVYNVAARTAQDITPDIMENLAEHPNFAGIKECAGTERIKHYTDQGIVCWTGNDDEAHQDRYEGGATGVISVTSNVAPKLMHQLMHDGPDADLRDRLLPLMNWLFAEPNPIGLNTLSAMTGMAKPVFRLPYVPYNRELREQGKAILEELGEDSFVHDGPVRVLEDSDFIIVSKY